MPPKKSKVWEHFENCDRDDSVKCKLCKKLLKHNNNTSKMRKHLIRNHPFTSLSQLDEGDPDNITANECASVANNNPPEVNLPDQAISSTSKSVTPNLTSSASTRPTTAASTSQAVQPGKATFHRQLKLVTKSNSLSEAEKTSIDHSLVKMIGLDLQPLSIVENQGFKEYSAKLQPLYVLRQGKDALIPHYVNAISNNIKTMLNETRYVAITTDIWSSDSNRSFCTVTCYFIQDDKQNNLVLETNEIPGSHTAINIAYYIAKILNKWEITNKVVAVVTDNGANIKAAVKNHFKKTHIPCVAHTLNLCVNDAIDDNPEFKDIIQKSKSYFKTSNLASDKLKEIQTQVKLPILKVLQDVSTRWNSTVIMARRLLHIREPICAALSHFPKAPESLDASEWQVLSDCVAVLEPLETMTEELSGVKYPTLSMIIPLIRSIQHALKSLAPNTEAGTYLRNKMVDVIFHRFSGWETNGITSKATFFDPRLKKNSFWLG